ncbi:GlsB/YeaQ/YmgE family stress response membrane protein [Ramlibacter sp. RBP-2]|uniref:GlsB/YeaQ/YmgE family stress response membrane protein n=1 Tax=Ramlibacter lithotrophicus TaxID=2606681 RepID=A0A7X6DHP0_9BURK|nr:GlsB/YeaQ/YmgE family stress response membrane protein [Ramlibacter lithotrophicus]NKE67339.1 GlsB/YeaQ/YmgE family stress response membrane protein [Ramlibacter lithotrophicus]
MHFIWSILIGFIVGLVARALMPGPNPMGFILTTILGVVGALVATFLGQGLGWYAEGSSAGFIASVVGAMILLFIYGLVSRRH